MSEPAKTRSDLQDEFREAVAKLDADRKLAEEKALTKIEEDYRKLRHERFDQYIAARDELLRQQAAAARKST